MRRAELERTIAVRPQILWHDWFHNQSFQDALCEVFRIVTSEIQIREEGTWPQWTVQRSLVFDTDRDIPKVLLKVVRGVTRVTETTRFNAQDKQLTVDLKVPVIGKLVDYGYTYSWTQTEEESMHVVWNGHCDVRIPMIRGLAEKYLLGELTDATRAGADFIAKWYAGCRQPE